MAILKGLIGDISVVRSCLRIGGVTDQRETRDILGIGNMVIDQRIASVECFP